MLDSLQGPVEARRRDFEHVLAAHGLVRIERVPEPLTDRLAVVDAHAPDLVGAVEQHPDERVGGRARHLDVEHFEAAFSSDRLRDRQDPGDVSAHSA
jgi:hypothetical protein